jgi:large subunit ribosomal protein L23
MLSTELLKTIIKPLSTEKSKQEKDMRNKYVFRVHMGTNKVEIKKAIEFLFKVNVEAVNTFIIRGKVRKVGKHSGKRSDWKKAMVTIKKGESIKLSEEP